MNFAALVLVPILYMTDAGVEYRDVELPEPNDFKWLVCVREYESPAIRCYAVGADKEIRYADYDLKR